MNVKKNVVLVALAVVLALLALGAGLVALQKARHAANVEDCQDRLGTLRNAIIILYRRDHAGAYPRDLFDLNEDWGGVTLVVARCPGASGERFESARSRGELDYVYIDWSRQPKGEDWDDGEYPLLYDRRLVHHGGGVNVVTVGGRIFWDPDGIWLRSFADTHRNADVPLPE